jgi:hypoxanthine phosphoribosyltransferase
MSWLGIMEFVWNNVLVIAITLLGAVIGVIQLRKWYVEYEERRVDNFASVEKDAIRLLEKIEASNFQPHFVLCLGRSGAFLGGWLAGNLGSLPIELLDRHFLENDSTMMSFPNAEAKIKLMEKLYPRDAQVLVVEGATTTGTTFFEFQKLRKKAAPNWQCKSCVLYEVKSNRYALDFVAKRIKEVPHGYAWHRRGKYRRAMDMTKSLAPS